MNTAEIRSEPYALEMRGITKTFTGVQVLSDVDFSVKPGEVHALMGQNGAGKSTLIKILTGVYQRDSGGIIVNGRQLNLLTPRDAQDAGISAIHQEVALLPYLSVAENIFIGRQPMKGWRIDWQEINRRSSDIMQSLGVPIDVTLPLGHYPLAVRQMVSIARAVDCSCDILVMDEPTSSLDQKEVGQLFDVIRRLRDQGKSVVFITHFIDQVYEICDRITVLRNGQQVGVFETEVLTKLDLVSHMLGKKADDVNQLFNQKQADRTIQENKPILQVQGLGRKGSMNPFDLEIRESEVLGLAGLLGSGRTEVARLLFGVDKPDTGRITLNGRNMARMSPKRAIANGIGFSPEDRRTEGIIPDLSVRENIVIAMIRKISPLGLVSHKVQREIAEKFVKMLNISVADIEQPVKHLSGGNQQKVILARWLAAKLGLLILDEPTRGIDIGAKSEIEGLIESLSKEGTSVLFISSELDEVIRRSHRIAVLKDRTKVAEVSGEQMDEHIVMNLMAKGGSDEHS
ncbi:MAG: sugar ABC transporter ATP-binding protein [Armatimonadota bacterium]